MVCSRPWASGLNNINITQKQNYKIKKLNKKWQTLKLLLNS